MLRLLYGLFVLKDVSFFISRVRKSLRASTSLGLISCSAPALHIVGYLEASRAVTPEVAPWRGGRSPPVLPPPGSPRRSAAGCGEAVTQLSVTRASASALRCPSAPFATSSNHVCGVMRHLLRTRSLGVFLFFFFCLSHGSLQGHSSCVCSESMHAVSLPRSPG